MECVWYPMNTSSDSTRRRCEACKSSLRQKKPLELKGLKSLDPNVARMITKLLVKDPAERLTAHKVLTSSFFKIMDDTTHRAASAEELSQVVRSMAGKSRTLLALSAVLSQRPHGQVLRLGGTRVAEWPVSLIEIPNQLIWVIVGVHIVIGLSSRQRWTLWRAGNVHRQGG